MQTVELLKCSQCHGKGYTAVRGFDGNERTSCDNCDGKGTIEYFPVSLEEIVAEQAAWDATVAAVEEFLGVAEATPLSIDHPNMSPGFFDTAIKRAHDAGLTIRLGEHSESAFVSSASNPGISYLTTRTSCTCTGGQTIGRCLHRAYLIFHLDVVKVATREPIAA